MNQENDSKTYEGVAEGFFETGTEGVIWAVYKDGGKGHEGLVSILDGDHLTVWDPTGAVLFEGVVACDYKTGWRRYPRNPELGQQIALGMWAHWVQEGMEPDAWARLFFPADQKKPNRARFVRGNQKSKKGYGGPRRDPEGI
jgi:hypothetical protein